MMVGITVSGVRGFIYIDSGYGLEHGGVMHFRHAELDSASRSRHVGYRIESVMTKLRSLASAMHADARIDAAPCGATEAKQFAST